jgi:lysophospholipase L1-like esterase
MHTQSFTISVEMPSIPRVIMPCGDSITDGAAGSSDDTGYRRELYLALEAAGYPVDFVGSQTSGIPTDFDRDHEGHGGWRADQIRDNISNWLVANPPDIVLLHIGTNDISGGNQDVQEVNDILTNIDLYESNNSTHVKVLVARIILRNDGLNPQTIAFNNAVEAMVNARIAAGDDLVMVDMENALVYPGDLADTVHPDDGGYSKMADTWFAALDPILEGMLTDVLLRSESGDDLDTDDLIVDYTLGADAVTAAVAWFVDTSSPIMSLYLPMEGGSADALNDYSGNGTAATANGNPVWTATAGHDGHGAFSFDGNDDLDGGEGFPTASSYTKTAWVYRTGSGSNGGNNIISGDENAGGHAFWTPDTYANKLSAGHNGTWNIVQDSVALALNTWYFVAVTYDYASDELVLYKNGVEIDRGVAGQGNVTDTTISIGSFGASNGYMWMGKIDDARVYKRALSPEQIAALYAGDPNVLVAEETEVDDEWWAEVTPFSDTAAGLTRVTNSIIIQPSEIPGPPTITSAAVTDAALGQPYVYDVDASGLPAPTFLLVQAPADMDINSVTGVIEWTSTIVDDYDIIVEANNIHGYDQQTFTINVSDTPVCDANMTHYYHLDETSSPFTNSAGTAAATCTNCPTAGTGIVNGAQYFDGVDDEVNIADDGTFDWPAGSSFSIEYWMKSTSGASGNDVIVGRQGPTNPHIWVGVADSGDQALFVVLDSGGSNGGNGDWPYGGADITDGQWHHVVAVKDSTHLRIYVDGSEKDSVAKSYPNGFGSTTDLNIGYLNLGGHYRYEGLLDEVAIYNRALTSTEVAEHWAAGLVGEGYCGSVSTIVPNCVGDTQAQAETEIVAASLTVGTISHAYSDTVPAGNVISQYPAAGAVVLEGIAVDLLVSDGPHMVTVPDVRGQSQAVAEAAITAAGLTVGTVSHSYSMTVPAGDVISQNPSALSSAPLGTPVDIVVSDGMYPDVTIRGYILEPDAATAAADVRITTDGDANTVTDANGLYELVVAYGWSGVVTPVKDGWTFDPCDSTYGSVTTDLDDQDYETAMIQYIISGHVLEVDGITGVNDVNVTASNGGGDYTSRYGGGADITDVNGLYELIVDHNWTGYIMPTREGYAFEPDKIDYINVLADANDQDYTGALMTFSISGYVRDPNNRPLQDVILQADNGGGADVTDANGFYELWVDYKWSGAVTPSKPDWTFIPDKLTYISVDSNTAGDYTGVHFADFNADGFWNYGDIAMMADYWLDTDPSHCNINGDNIVDYCDYAGFAPFFKEE